MSLAPQYRLGPNFRKANTSWTSSSGLNALQCPQPIRNRREDHLECPRVLTLLHKIVSPVTPWLQATGHFTGCAEAYSQASGKGRMPGRLRGGGEIQPTPHSSWHVMRLPQEHARQGHSHRGFRMTTASPPACGQSNGNLPHESSKIKWI